MKPVSVVFDLFGTLLNVASLREAAARVTDDPVTFVATWREKQLAYAHASSNMDAYEDFDAMTLYGLRYAAAKYNVALDATTETALVTAWENVLPYDDAIPALKALKALDINCSVLTNGTPATSHRAMATAGIDGMIDVLLSVESVGVYKPNRRVYALVDEYFKTTADRVMFVTSNGWDATGAAGYGMPVVWCNRLGAPPETFGPPPRWTIADLHGLAAAVASFS